VRPCQRPSARHWATRRFTGARSFCFLGLAARDQGLIDTVGLVRKMAVGVDVEAAIANSGTDGAAVETLDAKTLLWTEVAYDGQTFVLRGKRARTARLRPRARWGRADVLLRFLLPPGQDSLRGTVANWRVGREGLSGRCWGWSAARNDVEPRSVSPRAD
jgi:hypothetical protein